MQTLSRNSRNHRDNRNGTIKLDNVRAAKEAGLVYVSDESPGIHRRKSGGGFTYVDENGKTITNKATLARIQHLAIPPAWHDVWICPSERGHIQAVGRDDRGRKQYRYHEKWREVRDQDKYGHMIAFARALPKIRRAVARDLRRKGLPREKVLAAVVRFMETTLIRVGNDEYAKNNHSFGLTTLRDRHAKIARGKVKLEFRGKSGVEHEFEVQDPRLAQIAKACQDLPGQELFQYLDADGKVCDIGSGDVNEYLRQVSGSDFTAKDFRTWAGTVLAAGALAELKTFDSQAQAKRNVVKAVEAVAAKLGNTKAVCRKCYIHPEIFDAYLDGQLVMNLAKRAAGMAKSRSKLGPEEAAVLALLRRRLAAAKKTRAAQPKTLRQALQRSLKLVQPPAATSTASDVRRRRAS
jgi:DNA topoisomerase-1